MLVGACGHDLEMGLPHVIRARRIVTSPSEPVVDGGFVLVRDGHVVAVEGPRVDPPRDADLHDLGDVTLLPGLVDAHVHLAFEAGDDVVTPLVERTDDELDALMRSHAARHLDAGVTTVRDLGDRRFGSLALRGAADLPDVLVAGPPITRRKGHCWFLGGEAETIGELEAAVAERAAHRCDVVKLMATGGVLTPGFMPYEAQYGPAELAAVVAVARDHGIRTAAHAHAPSGIRDSVDAGFDSIEHCTFFTEASVDPDWDVIERMAERGTYVGTTSAVVPGIDPPPVIQSRLETITNTMARMRDLGVRIVCSSDAGIAPTKPHGVLPFGLVKLAQLFMSNAEAIASATSVAAAACGVDHRKGRIAPGFDADLLAVHGDPLATIDDLQRVAAVYRAGERVR